MFFESHWLETNFTVNVDPSAIQESEGIDWCSWIFVAILICQVAFLLTFWKCRSRNGGPSQRKLTKDETQKSLNGEPTTVMVAAPASIDHVKGETSVGEIKESLGARQFSNGVRASPLRTQELKSVSVREASSERGTRKEAVETCPAGVRGPAKSASCTLPAASNGGGGGGKAFFGLLGEASRSKSFTSPGADLGKRLFKLPRIKFRAEDLLKALPRLPTPSHWRKPSPWSDLPPRIKKSEKLDGVQIVIPRKEERPVRVVYISKEAVDKAGFLKRGPLVRKRKSKREKSQGKNEKVIELLRNLPPLEVPCHWRRPQGGSGGDWPRARPMSVLPNPFWTRRGGGDYKQNPNGIP